MNFKIPVAGMLLGLLVACNETKPESTTVSSTLKQQQAPPSQPEVKQLPETKVTKQINPFDKTSFPQEVCGDKLPHISKTNTVKVYRIFIEYNESNLQTIKANYCQDAYLRKDKGKQAIQVATFVNKERANQFKEFLENKLGNVSLEVGEPTVRAVKNKGDRNAQSKKANDSTNTSSSAYSIGEKAKLTPAQVKKLIEMEKRKAYKGLGSKKEIKTKFVLPTYTPSGFNVNYLITRYYEKLGGVYEIVYCNSSKSCFLIGGGAPVPIGDPPINYETIRKISSPALGKVELGYVNFDKKNNITHIGFTGSLDRFWNNNNEYTFTSSVGSVISPDGGYGNFPNNKTISLNEAVKIVESLQYMNP